MPSLPGFHRFFVLGAFLCSQNSLYKLKRVLQNTRYMFILNICNSNVCIYTRYTDAHMQTYLHRQYKHKDTDTHLHGYACADSVCRATCEHASTDAPVKAYKCACVHTQKSINTHAHTLTHTQSHTFSHHLQRLL